MINSQSDRKYEAPISDPQIADVFNLIKRETMLDINCVQVGTIESYSSLTNTAEVSINVKRKLKNGDELEYPTLEDCPVFMLYGGTSSITMPISSGDSCLVLFNDRCIEDWFTMGEVVAPSDRRVHSLSDGIVLVGVKPMTKQVVPLSSNLCIHGGGNKIVIRNTAVDLKKQINDMIASINNVIDLTIDIGTQTNLLIAQNLLTTQQLNLTTNMTTVPPQNAAAFTPITTAIGEDITNLGLEKGKLVLIDQQINALLNDS